MTDTKPPQKKKAEGEDNPKLSVLEDIEKSAKDATERTVSLLTATKMPVGISPTGQIDKSGRLTIGTPFDGRTVLTGMPLYGTVIADIERSARAFNELATSPAIIQAGKVVASIQQFSDKFTAFMEPSIKLAEAAKVMVEPLDRLRSSVVSLNKKYDFDLSIEAISLYPSASPSPSYSPSPSPSPSPAFEVKAAVMVLKERLDNLADEITFKVEGKIQEIFDKSQKKNIIQAESQEKLLYCKYCSTQLFRVRDFPAFIVGIRTHKCTNKDCGRSLQIPADLKIKDL